MVIIGIDAHKYTHTVVCVDGQGRQLATKKIGTTTADHLALLSWAGRHDKDCCGRSRTAGSSRAAWSVTCSRQDSESCGCRRS